MRNRFDPKRRFAHIISPVCVEESSSLFVAQPITFKSMENAKCFAKNDVDVDLFSAHYPEDKGIIPEYFSLTPELTRSAIDLGTFKKTRKLPFIRDILDRLYEAAPDADYMIYSNVDISLMPHFYSAISKIADKGYDAFILNRRTISDNFTEANMLPLMYAEVGKVHPGVDCFVFKRDLYPHFHLAKSFLGTLPIARCITSNLVVCCNKFLWVQKGDFTFHVGDDRSWSAKTLQDYCVENFRQFDEILTKIISKDNFGTNSTVKRSLILQIKRNCEHVLRKRLLKMTGQIVKNKKFKGALPRDLFKLYSEQNYGQIAKLGIAAQISNL